MLNAIKNRLRRPKEKQTGPVTLYMDTYGKEEFELLIAEYEKGNFWVDEEKGEELVDYNFGEEDFSYTVDKNADGVIYSFTECAYLPSGRVVLTGEFVTPT